MALSASSMASRIKTNIAAVADPSTFPDKTAYADACRQAMCQGIIDEIKANGLVTVVLTSGAGVPGGGNGTIT